MSPLLSNENDEKEVGVKGENGSRLFIFLLLKNNKRKKSEAEAEKKTLRRFARRRYRTISSENVCQCVNPDWEKCSLESYIPLSHIN